MGRISAQVVSGIGFLGAGTIFISQKKIAGLTTAASPVECRLPRPGGWHGLLRRLAVAGCAIVMITLALLQKPGAGQQR